MDSKKFDDVFMGVLQHCEQVETFLDAMFSFLSRRTDFFRVMHSRDDKMGFPPGVAENIVLKVFKRYQEIPYRNETSKRTGKPEARADLPSTLNSTSLASDDCATPSPSETETQPAEAAIEIESSHPHGIQSGPTCSAVAADSSFQIKEDDEHDGRKGLTPGKSADCYNGAVLDRYSWSQTIRDIEIKIPVPIEITKGRDVGVEIKSTHLKVWLKKGVSPTTGNSVLLEGKLQRRVKCEESMWLLEGGKFVIVNLEKSEERFWTSVLDGDIEIDKTRVDTTRNISDFDEQTQSDFEHVMYDHHQKLQGKPTSQEKKTHELLKQAWNAKGSPFAGTEFDPSKVNVSLSYG
ncbi:nudC domain-containing protein 3-like [Montipora foliosa]|uniref:nudC domain-containing protein 3-like n=1 Tax=Montipora foliosa TaxID=591990 RepID=UPI0035F21195